MGEERTGAAPGRAGGPDLVSGAGVGVAPPDVSMATGEPIAVARSFAFIDITGFTAFCDRQGEQAAIRVLTRFRSLVRDVAARRGVRVAKWLGDGAMLVGVSEPPIVATMTELIVRCQAVGLDTHAGVSTGTVLLFEGDDYVGRPANLAARLCDVAAPGQVLASRLDAPLPEWVEDRGPATLEVSGVGEVTGVHDLHVVPELAARLRRDGAAA